MKIYREGTGSCFTQVSPLLPVPSVIIHSSNMLTISSEEEKGSGGNSNVMSYRERKTTGETPENAVSFSPQRQTRGSSTLPPLQLNRWLQRL